MPTYSDEELVLETLGDSHLAFGQFVKQYQYRVLRTIASIISDEQATQDVAQETFLLAWNKLDELRDKHKFAGWLNQIAINSSKLCLIILTMLNYSSTLVFSRVLGSQVLETLKVKNLLQVMFFQAECQHLCPVTLIKSPEILFRDKLPAESLQNMQRGSCISLLGALFPKTGCSFSSC